MSDSASPVPFTDNHMHLDPGKGIALEAVKKFSRSGGRRIFLVCKTTRDWDLHPKDEDSFQKLYQHTLALAREVKDKTGVEVYPVLGVHPVEVVWMCRSLSFPRKKTPSVRVGMNCDNIKYCLTVY